MVIFSEFRTFIARGNVIDMAVGIIMGAAFTSIVKSLVEDIIMPVIGVFTKGVDFTNLYINLGPNEYESLSAARSAGAATLNYGLFINAVISFLIVSLVVFFLVKGVNRIKERAEDPKSKETKPSRDIQLLTEIRDLLAAEQGSAPSKS